MVAAGRRHGAHSLPPGFGPTRVSPGLWINGVAVDTFVIAGRRCRARCTWAGLCGPVRALGARAWLRRRIVADRHVDLLSAWTPGLLVAA